MLIWDDLYMVTFTFGFMFVTFRSYHFYYNIKEISYIAANMILFFYEKKAIA